MREFKNFVGCKIISASECTYGDYVNEEYNDKCKGEVARSKSECAISVDEAGYLVKYPPIGKEEEPHMSWCPKDIFEKCYRIVEDSEISMLVGLAGCNSKNSEG